MTTRLLECLFKPKSVALVGASGRVGSLGRAVFDNLRAGGFKGTLSLVNPRHKELEGLPCVARISDLPAVPELVVVAAPRDVVPALVAEAAAIGVKGAIVITADPEHGVGSLAAQLAEIARTTGIRVVGPNCLGLVSPRSGLDASFAAHRALPGDLAVISQSGAVATALLAWAHERKVGFSGLVSVGDMADVDFADLLDYFALDHQTRAILLYVESIGDAKGFMSAARAAARVKPVIVIKSGRHPRAAKAAATHTGALAGADAVYDAAFRRAGLLRVNDISELFAAAEALGRIKAFTGDRAAILTNGGGLGVITVDNLLDLGGKLAEISPETMAILNATLPVTWSHANPVDIVGDADAHRYRVALTALLDDDANDAVIVVHCPTALSKSEATAKEVVAVVQEHRRASLQPKPVFVVWLGATQASDEMFEAARIPNYRSGATRGFMHVVRWRENRDALMAVPPNLPADFEPDVAAARSIVADALAAGHTWLGPVAITGLLEAYDIPIAPARMAATPEDVAAPAAALIAQHGACVIKILSPDITHKSDVGGVVLGLETPEAAVAAARAMLVRIAAAKPQARLEGVTVHPMVRRPHARELIAGIAEDPTFGPVIVFGRGGKAVEVINDRALALPPLDLRLAHDLIERTRVVRILRTYRDEPAADIDATALLLVKLSQLSADIPEIRELDLNPILCDDKGVIVIDARIAIAPAQSPHQHGSNLRFAIAPYPKGWERDLTLRDGAKIFLRPVRPEDEGLYRAFFESVPALDLRLRFFAPVKEFSHTFVARLTQIDYARAFAICAIEKDTGFMVGGVRLIKDAEATSGEYAILLRSDYKGRGLGWNLMKLMIEYAQDEGLARIEGQVLAKNTTMLTMCEQLGFRVRDDPQEHGIKLVRLNLQGQPDLAARLPV
ncbi:MAG: family N-acetyltransferase [Hyphomicrobiales bacterium]|nr:family N-acetyltransferase [Hyphomicrobiales bacterium]